MKPRVCAGNVYITRVQDGRYTAVRILRVVEKSSLVETCAYLEHERPALSDIRLRNPVTQHRFQFRGDVARRWLDGYPPRNFELLGTLPATDDELAMECNTYGGKWNADTGNEAYREWRWVHEKDALEQEQRQRTAELEQLKRAPQKPKKMIDEDTFWSIISQLDWRHAGDDERVLAPAIAALASRSTRDIRRWEERLAYLLFQLDTKAHATSFVGGQSENLEQISADAFLYARCAVVANGRALHDAVRHDPSRMPHDVEFEALLTTASRAFELKTGDDLDYVTGCSYETFANTAGWGPDRDSHR